MAAPTTTNEVTVRRLSDVVTGLWGKVKEYAVADVAWDSTNNKLTKTVNGTASDVVTRSNLLSALGGSIADGNTGFVTGDAAYDALALKANLAGPTFTGTPKAPTATAGTNTTQIATTAFVKTAVDNAIATADALTYKGTVAGGSTGDYGALTPAASKGDLYKVSTAGKIDGVKVEVGDMLICNTDSTAEATSSNYSTIVANWDFIQTNIDGAVTSSASSVTTNTVAVFDGTTGKIIKSSGYTIGKSVPSTAVFTDASVTAVGNHYAPTTDSTAEKDASGGTATQLPTSSGSSNVQVVTGIKMDAKGHVTGVVSKGLWSPNTTYSNQAAASGGNTESLCTTGEKYTWNNKQDLISDLDTIRAQAGGAVRYDASQELSADQKTQARSNIGAGTSDLTIGTTASTAAAGNHTHNITLASDTGTSTVTLAHGGKYKLTAGGKSVIFTMPASGANNGALKIGLNGGTAASKFTANQSTDSTLTFATGSTNGTISVDGTDVAVKGLGSAAYTESTAYATSGHTHTASIATSTGESSITLASAGKYALTAGGSSVIFTMPAIPAAAANGALKVQLNGGTATSKFTANQSTDSTLTFATGSTNGTIAVDGTDVAVKGLGSAAYTASTAYAASSHSHGNITSGGALQTTDITIANGDKLVVTDASSSNKVARTSISFDASTATKALTKKGTWEDFQAPLTEMTTTEVDDLLAALT